MVPPSRSSGRLRAGSGCGAPVGAAAADSGRAIGIVRSGPMERQENSRSGLSELQLAASDVQSDAPQ